MADGSRRWTHPPQPQRMVQQPEPIVPSVHRCATVCGGTIRNVRLRSRFALLLLIPLSLTLAQTSLQIQPQAFISKNPSERQQALRTLSGLSAEQKAAYIPLLIGLLHQDGGYPARLAFAKIGQPAIPALIPMLDDKIYRDWAASAIAMIRPADPAVKAKVVEKIRAMLDDGEPWRERPAATALLSMGVQDAKAEAIVKAGFGTAHSFPGQTIPQWIAMLARSDSFNAEQSLQAAGAAAVPALLAALDSPDNNTRAGASHVLNNMQIYRDDVDAACIKHLNDVSARVRDNCHWALVFKDTEAAQDALLQYEIGEAARMLTAQRQAASERARGLTRDQVLAPIPPDADFDQPATVTDQAETKASDGTAILAAVHTGERRPDLMRVWILRAGRYYLLKTAPPDGDYDHLSVDVFNYSGKSYLHIMYLSSGTGYQHSDVIYRVAAGNLTKLKMPKGLPPIKLAKGEGVWKGFVENFQDDSLTFEFYIWNEDDTNCCPTAGTVVGAYTIVGNELRYKTWQRLAAPSQD
jgi:hypothetical protein